MWQDEIDATNASSGSTHSPLPRNAGAALAGDPPAFRRLAGLGYVTQAGVSLGLALGSLARGGRDKLTIVSLNRATLHFGTIDTAFLVVSLQLFEFFTQSLEFLVHRLLRVSDVFVRLVFEFTAPPTDSTSSFFFDRVDHPQAGKNRLVFADFDEIGFPGQPVDAVENKGDVLKLESCLGQRFRVCANHRELR